MGQILGRFYEDNNLLKNITLREAENKAREEDLRKLGHNCIHYGETFPKTLIWCKQTPCRGLRTETTR